MTQASSSRFRRRPRVRALGGPCDARGVSFSRRNPDDPEPRPWNWKLLGPAIAMGAVAFYLTFVIPPVLFEPGQDGVISTEGLWLSLVFVVTLTLCLVLGYVAVHQRIRDPEDD